MVAVESQDASLVRLGHVCKHNIHHTYRKGVGGGEGRGEGRGWEVKQQ